MLTKISMFTVAQRLYRWLTVGRIPLYGRLAICVLLGMVVGILLFMTPVRAASTILLQSSNTTLSIPFAELQAFARDGEMSPNLQDFFQEVPQNPDDIRRWISAEITPRPQRVRILPDEFVLLQINKTLGSPLQREDLQSLKTAYAAATEDDGAYSVVEVLEHYPGSEVRLEVDRLGKAYADTVLFVTRMKPILEIAEQLLPELVGYCTAIPNASQQEVKTVQFPTARLAGNKQNNIQPAPTNDSPISSPVNENQSWNPNHELVLSWGPFSRSISIGELTTFAETGELSPGWRFFLNLANLNPDDLRAMLTQEVAVDFNFLDEALNSLLGEFLLYKIGQIFHPPSHHAVIQALRSALVLSAATDNRFSFLEVLQHYPTPQVNLHVNQLARLERGITSFTQRAGTGVVLDLEDWWLSLQASSLENNVTRRCRAANESITPSPSSPPDLPPEPNITTGTIAQFLPAHWQPVPSHRDERGIIKVVWLQGTPYDMGYQHGQLLHDEIAAVGNDVLSALRFAGRGLALGRLATTRSYPDVVEECQGLVDATADIGMTLDACMVLAYGDVYQEMFSNTLPNILFWNGCSQFVATDQATIDGHLYHGSSLDNDESPVSYILENPVVFVRQPNAGLPHIFIAYPGVVWPNWGMNVAGITIGLDTAHPNSPNELSLEGRSNVQTMAEILKTATHFAEARTMMESQPRARANLIMITDGKSRQAGVFEFTGKSLSVRELQRNGVLYTTNHFVLDRMYAKQSLPPDESSVSRFDRFAQLMEPNGIASYYGEIDPNIMARIGRDRVNPYTLEESHWICLMMMRVLVAMVQCGKESMIQNGFYSGWQQVNRQCPKIRLFAFR